MSYLNGIKCPVCGESVSASCDVSRGSPGSFFDPPEPDEVTWDVSEFEFECTCRDNIEQNAQSWTAPSVKKQPEVIRVESTPSGFVRWWSKIEYHKDENGAVVNKIVCPMLEAYDDDLNRQAENADYTYEPPDPPEYDDY